MHMHARNTPTHMHTHTNAHQVTNHWCRTQKDRHCFEVVYCLFGFMSQRAPDQRQRTACVYVTETRHWREARSKLAAWGHERSEEDMEDRKDKEEEAYCWHKLKKKWAEETQHGWSVPSTTQAHLDGVLFECISTHSLAFTVDTLEWAQMHHGFCDENFRQLKDHIKQQKMCTTEARGKALHA